MSSLTACTGAAAPAAGSSGPGASLAGSPAQASAPQASVAQPSSAASPAAAPTPGSTAASSAQGGSAAADPAKKYDCKKLLTDPEIQQATGLSSAAFLSQELWTDTPGLPEGQTYCQFFARQGALSIALTVATGPAFTLFEAAAAGAAGLDELPGIGDHAVYSATSHLGAARRGGTLVIVKFADMSGSGKGFADVDTKSAATKILGTVIGRV